MIHLIKNKLLVPLLLFQFQVSGYGQKSGSISSEPLYNIGYQTIYTSDFGRPVSVDPIVPRVIPIHIWYPAKKSSKTSLLFIDYVESDKNFTWDRIESTEMLYRWVRQFEDSVAARQISGRLAIQKTIAVKNAKPVQAKFPVVLFGNGLTAPGFMYTSLSEYLATRGYVVISYPSLPENKSVAFAFSERGFLNQLADMASVINKTSTLPMADFSKTALISWSFGGATQIIYQMKYKFASAIISLDAATQYGYGTDLITKSVYYTREPFETPFLQIIASGKNTFNVPRSSYFYDSLCVNKKSIVYPDLNHAQMLPFVQSILYVKSPGNEKESGHFYADLIDFLDRKLKLK